jgi:hypothetical protein
MNALECARVSCVCACWCWTSLHVCVVMLAADWTRLSLQGRPSAGGVRATDRGGHLPVLHTTAPALHRTPGQQARSHAHSPILFHMQASEQASKRDRPCSICSSVWLVTHDPCRVVLGLLLCGEHVFSRATIREVVEAIKANRLWGQKTEMAA